MTAACGTPGRYEAHVRQVRTDGAGTGPPPKRMPVRGCLVRRGEKDMTATQAGVTG